MKENERVSIPEALDKFKKGFKDGKWEALNYYIDTIKNYYKAGELNVMMLIPTKDVFTVRALCGFVYCFIEYTDCDSVEKRRYGVDYVCGATFSNTMTGEEVLVQNFKEVMNDSKKLEEIEHKLWSIFD